MSEAESPAAVHTRSELSLQMVIQPHFLRQGKWRLRPRYIFLYWYKQHRVPPRDFYCFLSKYDKCESFNYRRIQDDSKFSYLRRTVSLFTKRALYGHHYL